MNKNKLLAAAAAGVLLTTSFPAYAATDLKQCPITLLGDANDNGSVSMADVVKLNKYLLGMDDTISINADLTGDGILNGFDLALLKRMQMGTYTPEDYTKLVINEVCASNKNSLLDSAGNAPDWVEIYNPTEQDIHLGGFGLSDGKKNLFKFTFPQNAVVPAGGYVIVFCDDGLLHSEQEYHAAFKISATGESIYLTHPANGTLDAVDIPASETDISYGRFANGSEQFGFLTPTPGKSNDEASRKVDAPIFSMESGFYDSSFDLTITGAGGCDIYYTTDGTDPTTSSTAKRYTGSISIYNNTSEQNVHSAVRDISLDSYNGPNGTVDKGMIIRAAAKSGDDYSNVVTKSYFIGKNAAYYQDMRVISLVTDPANLFDPETGIYVVGNGYYAWKNSPDYIKLDNWSTDNPTNYNQSGREWERPASVQIFENGTLAYENGVGIRICGHASRGNFQKSIRLYARSEYGSSKMKYDFFEGLTDTNGNPIHEYDKVTLRNGGNDINCARFRDDLVQAMVTDRDISTQAAENAVVFIDGEFWGFYTIKERMDDEYLASHYGVDKNNVTTIKIGEIEGDAAVGKSYEDFYRWAMSADLSTDDNYQKVCDTIDIQSFMDYFTIETYVCNYDFSNKEWYNNWQMWRVNTPETGNAYGDGKWRFMLYDTEYSSGLYGESSTSASYDMLNNMHTKEGWANLASLFYHLMDNAQFRKDFAATYKEIVQTNFAPERVMAQIDSYASAQQQVMPDTNKRFFGSSASWYNNLYPSYVQEVRDFYQKRPDYALKYLDNLLIRYEGGEIPTEPVIEGSMLTSSADWSLYRGTAMGWIDASSPSEITICTTATGSETWEMQAVYSNLHIEAGKTYQLSYTIYADAPQTIAAHVQEDGGNYYNFTWKMFQATTQKQSYTQTFTASMDCTKAKVGFDAGYGTGTFYLSDISLICLD